MSVCVRGGVRGGARMGGSLQMGGVMLSYSGADP